MQSPCGGLCPAHRTATLARTLVLRASPTTHGGEPVQTQWGRIVEDAHREQPKSLKSPASDVGTVRVICRPAPDAEDRLRRLFTLLVKHATKDREPPSQ